MLKVKLYFFSSFLVEVVCFFVTYDLARNKTGSVKGWDDRIVQKRQAKTHNKMDNRKQKCKQNLFF